MNQEEKLQIESDEIDLMDYIKIVLRRKWLILGVFFGTVMIMGAYSWFSPKVYKINTLLEIGTIEVGAVRGILETPEQVMKKIENDIYRMRVREKLNIPENGFLKLQTKSQENTNLVQIEIESANPQRDKYILTEMNKLILEDHQEKITIKKESLREDITGLQIEILYPTKIIKSPTISAKPVKPRFLFNITIAGVLGLFLGIAFAFGKEWWDKNKSKI